MLMFVGGGSASTAGGIKVTTLAILFLAAFAEARGADDMEAGGRRIPVDVLRLAVSVVLWGATIVAASTWVFGAVALTAVLMLLAALRLPRGGVDSRAYSTAPSAS